MTSGTSAEAGPAPDEAEGAPDPGSDPHAEAALQRTLREVFRPILRGRTRALVALSASALAFGLAEAAVLILVARIAFAMSKGLDSITAGIGPFQASLTVGETLLVTIAAVVVRGALQVGNGWQSARLVTEAQAATRKHLAAAYLNATWERQHQEKGGRLQELLTTFVAQVSTVVDSLAKGVTSVFSLIALMVAAIYVSPIAAIGLLVALGLLGLTLQPLRRVIRRASRAVADTNLDFAGAVSQFSTIGREVQTFGVEEPVNEELDRLIAHSAGANMRQSFLSSLFTPMYATVMLLLLVGTLSAIWITNLSDLEELSAIMLIMLRSLAYGQLAQNVYAQLHGSVPYLNDLDDQLAGYLSDAVKREGAPVSQSGALSCEGVSYSYGEHKLALDAITFSIDPGEVVGIIGPSGSGKSTLVQLLLRLRFPQAGSIRYSGIPIDQLAIDDWRHAVSYVPQEARMIDGTVRENIRFFRAGVSDEMVVEAAREAHIHDEIEALPKGYDTEMGGAGVHVSGGQQQRICIARALAAKPRILILDEPTSALDAQSERGIRLALSSLRGQVTTVIVAHRMSTLDACSRIMVIEDGELRAFDTPAALKQSSEFYNFSLSMSATGD